MANASPAVVRTDQETFSSIGTFFTWDHRRLDGQLEEVMRLVIEGDLARARKVLAHFERGMRRHMLLEEEVLSELYAFERTGAARSPGRMVQGEHAEILEIMEQLAPALARDDAPTFRSAAVTLVARLREHHEQEETVLYPLLDSLVGPAESEQLVARLRAE
jgi:hemerythrin-like domain-containing protein